MAHLVGVFRLDDHPTLLKRQAPLMIEDQLMMVMDLKGLDVLNEFEPLGDKEFFDFMEKYLYLTEPEIIQAFKVDFKDVMNILNESIPCVGCRRSVERLYYQLMEVGKLALDPILVDADSKLVLRESLLEDPPMLCTILSDHNERLNRLVETQPRNKKSKRCQLHSWDLQKARIVTPAWKEVWAVMHDKCKAEVTLIDFSMLLNKLETYLKKHRFCQDCRTKVMKAYNLLVEDSDPSKEKGFMPALYLGIRRCLPGKHIHLPPNTAYIDSLIARAEPELMGNRRDRHAKTMEIAQEEVLTCIGMCIYDRIHRVFLRLREEEFTCQVLAAAGVQALVRSFETLVEQKRGVSNLELLCQEISKEEMAKRQRKEMKKLKKKRKKERKNDVKDGCDECESDEVVDLPDENSCECPKVQPPANSDRQKLKILDRKSKGQVKCECEECEGKRKASENRGKGGHGGSGDSWSSRTSNGSDSVWASCLDNKRTSTGGGGGTDDSSWNCDDRGGPDCGYGSEIHLPSSGANSSPDGSEDACSEGFCDHDGECGSEGRVDRSIKQCRMPMPGPSLEEMLLSAEDDEQDDCMIPEEDIQAFQARSQQVDVKRMELRQVLKTRFNQLCIKAQTGSD